MASLPDLDETALNRNVSLMVDTVMRVRGVTRQQLAAYLNLKEVTVRHKIAGTNGKSFSLYETHRAAKLLQVDVNVLLNGPDAIFGADKQLSTYVVTSELAAA